jgi:adenosylcobyric acid synthase
MKGALMVCGTSSDAGKSHFVTGLCRLLARKGVAVAPFKAQNMALNSYVTASGHEIGRAQAIQALAAGVEPEVAMNPILLKPTGERTSQVVVNGEPVGHLGALEYHERKPELLSIVLEALASLRKRFEVVLVEGAGSPAEINLLDHDIVNLRIAAEANIFAIIVGDIDRGGVFASLYGTVALLPERYRRLVSGFVINKFRGDPALLRDGLGELEARCGVPTLGVVPFLRDVALDAEDSLALEHWRPFSRGRALADGLEVAVLRFPRFANATDLDALSIEPGVAVRLVEDAAGLGNPDLVVLPGTKATVADLSWLRLQGFDKALLACLDKGTTVLGICGGYQMLGHRIDDEVESGAGRVEGLGLLDVETVFAPTKLTCQRRGRALGEVVRGYEIHHGRMMVGGKSEPFVELDNGELEGASTPGELAIVGTSLHGLFDEDGFRRAFLEQVALRRKKRFVATGASFSSARAAQLDRLADALEAHVDLGALERLIEKAQAR